KVSKVPADVTQAIRDGQPIPDKRLAALSHFTQVMLETRGYLSDKEAETFLAAGFKENHMFLVILAIALKTITNYSNHISHPEMESVFSGYTWKASQGQF